MLHNFFEVALTAMIDDLTNRLSPYSAYIKQKFPIMIMNTGDEVFIQNINPDSGTKLYNRVPRMVLDPEGVSVLLDQLTSPHNLGKFVEQDIVSGFKSSKVANVRRIPIELPMQAQVYFSNVFEFFSFIEILFCTTFRDNLFDFYYNDIRHTGSYNYQDSFDPQTNKSLGFDSEKRQRIMNLTFNVDLQFPAFDYYNSRSLIDGANSIQQAQHRMHSNGVFNLGSAESIYVPQDVD